MPTLVPNDTSSRRSIKGRSGHPAKQGRHKQIAKNSNLCPVLLFSLIIDSRKFSSKLLTAKCPLSVGKLLGKWEGLRLLEVEMGKKKKTESLNLKNPKQLSLIHSFAVAEGRLSKEQILKEANKEIFYRMKNSGFIKETVKGSGIFKATGKLQSLVKKTEGIQFSVGCSSKHSAKITKAVSYLPQSVVAEGRFESGYALKQEMSAYKQTKGYQNKIEQMQKSVLRERKQIEARYQERRGNAENGAERYQAGIDYKADIADNQMKQDIIFSDNPLYVPDFKVTLQREEAEELLRNMKNSMDELEQGKEYAFLEQNVGKMEEILKTGEENLEVYFEVVTDSYGKRELEMHRNYEQVMEREVLYIY